jgi:hypothetical protein
VQRPHRAARRALVIKRLGLIESIVGVEMCPGLDFAIDQVDPVKTSLDQFL